jgi:hypothetical protein
VAPVRLQQANPFTATLLLSAFTVFALPAAIFKPAFLL